jgi:hypothetical protein
MLTKDPSKYEPPAPGTPSPEDLPLRPGTPPAPGAWKRIGKLAAEQAIPIAVGLVSLVIAVDAWLEARPMAWEKERALASTEITSSVVKADPKGPSEAIVTMKITNVGELTFAILDLHVRLETTDHLAGLWDANSLLAKRAAALPIGLRPFRLLAGSDSLHSQLQFDEKEKTWHVVDPGRSVEITFVQPVRGTGHLAVFVDLFTQPIKMADVAGAITVEALVNGVKRPTMPEWGTGEVSTMPIYPYSAGHVLIIPP